MAIPEPARHTVTPRRVTIAGAVGSTIEFYDFFIYGTATTLVFDKLFFPKFSPVAGTLAAFAIFAGGFAARPIGALIFGHFGDRIGRKATLVWTLMIMGLATFGIGLLPTYGTAGLWATVPLVVLRILQGFAVGGEWGGAAILVSEHAPQGRRGMLGAFTQLGSPAGLLLASLMFLLMGRLPDAQFLSWGWRVPFLLSLVMVGVGLYIRLRILDAPEFLRERDALRERQESEEKVPLPITEAVRTSWRNILIAMGARFAPDIIFYICATFAILYAKTYLGLPSGTILTGVIIAVGIELFTLPLFGLLSDRIGRRPVYMGGAAFCAVLAFPLFLLFNTKITGLIWLGLVLAFAVCHASMWSIAPAVYSEWFDTRFRYSGASIGYQLSIVFGAGPAPFIATALAAAAGGAPWTVAAYIAGTALISLVSLYLAKETYRRRLGEPQPAAAADSVA